MAAECRAAEMGDHAPDHSDGTTGQCRHRAGRRCRQGRYPCWSIRASAFRSIINKNIVDELKDLPTPPSRDQLVHVAGQRTTQEVRLPSDPPPGVRQVRRLPFIVTAGIESGGRSGRDAFDGIQLAPISVTVLNVENRSIWTMATGKLEISFRRKALRGQSRLLASAGRGCRTYARRYPGKDHLSADTGWAHDKSHPRHRGYHHIAEPRCGAARF